LDKEKGLGLQIREKVYGGDNGPFLEVGIPAVTIYRGGGTCSYIHTPDDRLDLVDSRHLALLAEQAVEFLGRVANAYRFPFKREVPKSIQEQLERMREEYFGPPSQGEKSKNKREGAGN
jgi:hypothetical protein